MWSRIVSAVVVLLLVGAAAWALWPRPIEVETEVIARRALAETVEEDGTSRIREVYHISAPLSGQLIRVPLHAGDPVASGQTIASIQPAGPGLLDARSRRIAQAAVEAAQAAVALAEANLEQAREQSSFAQAELERTSSLAERGLVSLQVAQKAGLDAVTASKNIDVAEATLTMRQQELESARAALIEGESDGQGACCAEVHSPIDGRVLSVQTESAQVVQAGTPLMDLGNPADLEVEVDVLSSDAVRISEGADASIEDWGGSPLKARVRRIDPIAITKVSALGIEEQRTSVVLDLLDPPEQRTRLGHGFRVTARIVVWHGKDLVAVPMAALFRRGRDWAVYVVKDGAAHERNIGIGHRNTEYAEVTTGLAPGEIVVLHPSDSLSDGNAVTIAAPAAQ
jgi:HlyD family secretion protein